MSALIDAVKANDEKLVKANLAETCKQDELGNTALMHAASEGYVKLVKLLAKESGMQNSEGTTALMFAAQNGHVDVAKALVGSEGGMSDQDGMTALIYAAQAEHPEIVKLLVSKEAGKTTSMKDTALMFAATTGNIAVVKLLAKEEKMQNGEGKTALMYAAEAGRQEVAMHLKKSEATIKDSNGRLAYQYADENGHSEIADILNPDTTTMTSKKSQAKSQATTKTAATKGSTASKKKGKDAGKTKSVTDGDSTEGFSGTHDERNDSVARLNTKVSESFYGNEQSYRQQSMIAYHQDDHYSGSAPARGSPSQPSTNQTFDPKRASAILGTTGIEDMDTFTEHSSYQTLQLGNTKIRTSAPVRRNYPRQAVPSEPVLRVGTPGPTRPKVGLNMPSDDTGHVQRPTATMRASLVVAQPIPESTRVLAQTDLSIAEEDVPVVVPTRQMPPTFNSTVNPARTPSIRRYSTASMTQTIQNVAEASQYTNLPPGHRMAPVTYQLPNGQVVTTVTSVVENSNFQPLGMTEVADHVVNPNIGTFAVVHPSYGPGGDNEIVDPHSSNVYPEYPLYKHYYTTPATDDPFQGDNYPNSATVRNATRLSTTARDKNLIRELRESIAGPDPTEEYPDPDAHTRDRVPTKKEYESTSGTSPRTRLPLAQLQGANPNYVSSPPPGSPLRNTLEAARMGATGEPNMIGTGMGMSGMQYSVMTNSYAQPPSRGSPSLVPGQPVFVALPCRHLVSTDGNPATLYSGKCPKCGNNVINFIHVQNE
ncbi:Ankyrin repeat protein 1 [Giardia muris]|uniref:Ankyrin repeat protein 1 n=1 Tax=Giardia muris TaxID=5742 RepID=A0A4Z1SQT6_GIAMU|nr:Ankyrin repeat protein 1 [Giardia muris]|eukprot:TNJ28232.1 Ankyrin repeat protein 1 [Giardia muris]